MGATTQRLLIDSERPDPRKIQRSVDMLSSGGIIAFPTDTIYGIGCDLHCRKAIDRIYKIRHLTAEHHLSFICPDLSNIAEYAHVSDFAYRVMRRLLPGPYTIILPASRMVPKHFFEKRREVGIRIPDHPICLALSKGLGHPIVSTTAIDPRSNEMLIDPDCIKTTLGNDIDLLIDGGMLTLEPSTVISLIQDDVVILREGKGSIRMFQ